MHIESLVKIHWYSLKLLFGNQNANGRTYDRRTDTRTTNMKPYYPVTILWRVWKLRQLPKVYSCQIMFKSPESSWRNYQLTIYANAQANLGLRYSHMLQEHLFMWRGSHTEQPNPNQWKDVIWANNVDPDQTPQMRRLIRVYTVCHSSSCFIIYGACSNFRISMVRTINASQKLE